MGRKIAVIVVVFLAFYLGAHFYIRWKNTVTDDVSKISRLVDCDPNELKALKISPKGGNPDGELVFQRSDQPRAGLSPSIQLSFSEWKLANPKGEADSGMMIRFASMFCELYDPIPTKESEFTPGEAAAEKIVFDLQGGNQPGEHTLFFGNTSSDRLNVVKYRAPNGDERFLKIQPKILQLAGLAPKEFLNMKVMRMSADNVMVASVFDGQKEKFTLERQDDGWRVLNAGKLLGKGSVEAAKYINRLTTLRAIKVNEEALSPTACDPTASRMRVQLSGVEDRKETLYFQYGKTGNLSVCNSARDALFTVHRDLVPYIEAPTKELIEKP